MDNRYHKYWDRENFAFHRTDPKPWIPFEDDRKWRINWKHAGMWLLCAVMLFGLPSAIRWLPL
jgi:hypothetical protein